MSADFCQQGLPFLNEGMGLLFEEEADLIFHHRRIALNDTRQVHKGIGNLACGIDHPRLLGFAKEPFQAFANDGATDIQHKVRHITLVITNETNGLIVARIHRLTSNEQRTHRLHEHPTDMTQRLIGDISWQQFYLPFHRQGRDAEIEERFADGHIDMYGGVLFEQSLVDKTVTVPI